MPNYYTPKTLADRLEVSLRTIYRWLDAGILPAPRRFGGLLRWPVQQIHDWEETR